MLCAIAINIPTNIVGYENDSVKDAAWTYCQTTEGMKLILREMARDSKHSAETGYGPLLPDRNVFRSKYVFIAAVEKAFDLYM